MMNGDVDGLMFQCLQKRDTGWLNSSCLYAQVPAAPLKASFTSGGATEDGGSRTKLASGQ